MLIIACVCVGERYGDEYVTRLRDGVARNLKDEHRFVALTDRQIEGVECVPVPPMLEGWWAKLWLFAPGVFPDGSRVLYFDLDTVITGNLSAHAAYAGDFAILRDFYRPLGMGSAVMSWVAGACDDIWDQWLCFGAPRFAGGDQKWIEIARPNADRWQDMMPGKTVSYKADCGDGPPPSASVVCFHGLPRPHQVNGWAHDLWLGRQLEIA